MSGPIVRKYGFPNFEKIFGHRELKHGVDEEEGKKEAPASDQAVENASPSEAGQQTGSDAQTSVETK
jgi:hypothetical protein